MPTWARVRILLDEQLPLQLARELQGHLVSRPGGALFARFGITPDIAAARSLLQTHEMERLPASRQ